MNADIGAVAEKRCFVPRPSHSPFRGVGVEAAGQTNARLHAASVSISTDIGEKLDPLDVVFGWGELSQPAVIAVEGSVFG